MRQLKFRVWDESSKKLLYPNLEKIESGEVVDSNKKVIYAHCAGPYTDTMKIGMNLNGTIYKQMCSSQEIITNPVVQQFTGLLDLENKEIYEGDILLLENKGPWIPFWNNDGVARFDIKNKNGDTATFASYSYTNGWKIIGNIFETPELLK